jgi:hypothetical protein
MAKRARPTTRLIAAEVPSEARAVTQKRFIGIATEALVSFGLNGDFDSLPPQGGLTELAQMIEYDAVTPVKGAETIRPRVRRVERLLAYCTAILDVLHSGHYAAEAVHPDMEAAEVRAQREWIEACGGDLAGYVATYGSKDDPEHYGYGGEAIYAADMAQLQRLEEQAARPRSLGRSMRRSMRNVLDAQRRAVDSRKVAWTPIIGIDYKEDAPNPVDRTYQRVVLNRGPHTPQQVFATGDVVADFKAAVRAAHQDAAVVMLSSTCDGFVFDSAGAYGWEETPEGSVLIKVFGRTPGALDKASVT